MLLIFLVDPRGKKMSTLCITFANTPEGICRYWFLFLMIFTEIRKLFIYNFQRIWKNKRFRNFPGATYFRQQIFTSHVVFSIFFQQKYKSKKKFYPQYSNFVCILNDDRKTPTQRYLPSADCTCSELRVAYCTCSMLYVKQQ